MRRVAVHRRQYRHSSGLAVALMAMGHLVSLHVLLETGLPPVLRRIKDLVGALTLPQPEAITFHAPGLAAEVLARAPLGEPVYGPLANQTCRYFSDSTGSWRWGRPSGCQWRDGSVQLLTHPIWWCGDRGRVERLCQDVPTVTGAFLPRICSRLKARGRSVHQAPDAGESGCGTHTGEPPRLPRFPLQIKPHGLGDPFCSGFLDQSSTGRAVIVLVSTWPASDRRGRGRHASDVRDPEPDLAQPR